MFHSLHRRLRLTVDCQNSEGCFQKFDLSARVTAVETNWRVAAIKLLGEIGLNISHTLLTEEPFENRAFQNVRPENDIS